MTELIGAQVCSHCGYAHHKKSGRLKYYVGAMQCPRYVELLLDEMDSWGVKVPGRPSGDATEPRKFACNAPAEFVCFHKGSPGLDGKPACMSPDGFNTQTQGHDKVRLVKLEVGIYEFERGVAGAVDERWDTDYSKLCPHRGPAKRRRRPKKEPGRVPRAKAGKGFKAPTGNRMPGAGDWRKERVFSELQRRIDYISGRGLSPTPARIAVLGGFTERAPR